MAQPKDKGPNENIIKYTAVTFVVIALITRIIYLYLYPTYRDADEAIVGLMAKNIAELKDFPFYYWGQSYLGALESYSVAVFYFFFGPSPFILRLVPTLYWFGSIPFLFQIWKKALSKKIAYISVVFMAIPSLFFSDWMSRARGGFTEIIFLGAVALWLFQIEKPRWSNLRDLFLGGTLGVAFWVNPQSVAFILPILVFRAAEFRQTLKKHKFRKSVQNQIAFISGLVLSLTPMILVEFHRDFPFTRFIIENRDKADFLEKAASNTLAVIKTSLPVLIGTNAFMANQSLRFIGYLLYLVFIAGLAFFICKNRKNFFQKKFTFTWSFPAALILFIVSDFGSIIPEEPRYLVLTVFLIPVVFAFCIDFLGKKSKLIFSTILAVFIITLVWNNYFFYRNTNAHRTDKITEYLEGKGIKAIYSGYWEVFPIIFYSEEQIIGSSSLGPGSNNRYWIYPREACKIPLEQTAVLVQDIYSVGDKPYLQDIRSAFYKAGIEYDEEVAHGYYIFTNFSSDPRKEESLKPYFDCK